MGSLNGGRGRPRQSTKTAIREKEINERITQYLKKKLEKTNLKQRTRIEI